MDLSKINTGKKSLNDLFKALGKTKLVKTDYSDDSEWQLTKDKDGNGSAKIRFLPSSDGEYFVEIRNHGFKENGNWFIENCPKTLDWDNPCPVCEHAQSLMKGRDWDKLCDADKSLIKPLFAKTSYFSNILVEVDPANPDNEGKVFKFRYGKKILEKIAGRAQDDPLDGSEGINVFDVMEGASLKLKCKKVAGFLNYDDSSWDVSKPILKGDMDAIDELIKTGMPIGDLRGADKFKPYADLQKRLNRVLGAKDVPSAPGAGVQEKEIKEEIPKENAFGKSESDDTDDSFSYFKQLAEDSEDVPF